MVVHGHTKDGKGGAHVTIQQLRALRRKHLIVIIRDLEKDLQNALSEKDRLMLAYQSGLEKRQLDDGLYADLLPKIPPQNTGPYIYSGRTDCPQLCAQPQQTEWQRMYLQQPYPSQEVQPQDIWQQPVYPQPYADAWMYSR